MTESSEAPLRIGLFGRGRLATAIADEIAARPASEGLESAWMVGRDRDPPEPAEVDVLIDASTAGAVEEHLAWAQERDIPLVVGATGWEIAGLEERVRDGAGVLVAPNFSLGAALLRRLARLLGGFADQEPERDPWVSEHHHRHKRDAPSGTARLLAEAVLEGSSRKREWVLVSGPVEPHQLSVSSIRAGTEFGTHVVGVDAPAETIEIRHSARSRRAFAGGAVEAARWIHGRRGLHGFDEVVADLLDPLFESRRTE